MSQHGHRLVFGHLELGMLPAQLTVLTDSWQTRPTHEASDHHPLNLQTLRSHPRSLPSLVPHARSIRTSTLVGSTARAHWNLPISFMSSPLPCLPSHIISHQYDLCLYSPPNNPFFIQPNNLKISHLVTSCLNSMAFRCTKKKSSRFSSVW